MGGRLGQGKAEHPGLHAQVPPREGPPAPHRLRALNLFIQYLHCAHPCRWEREERDRSRVVQHRNVHALLAVSQVGCIPLVQSSSESLSETAYSITFRLLKRGMGGKSSSLLLYSPSLPSPSVRSAAAPGAAATSRCCCCACACCSHSLLPPAGTAPPSLLLPAACAASPSLSLSASPMAASCSAAPLAPALPLLLLSNSGGLRREGRRQAVSTLSGPGVPAKAKPVFGWCGCTHTCAAASCGWAHPPPCSQPQQAKHRAPLTTRPACGAAA